MIFRGDTACSDREEFIDFCVKKACETFVLIVHQEQMFWIHISEYSNVRVRFTQICNVIKSVFRQ